MKLMSCLPENYRDSRETTAFQEALQPEADAIWAARDDSLAQLSPYTATWGLSYWESALGITPSGHLEPELRRRQIAAKLQGTGPTTAETIRNVAETLLGVPVAVTEVFDEYRVELAAPSGFEPGVELSGLKERLNSIMPAHLDWAWVIPAPAGLTPWLGCAISTSTLPMAEENKGG